MFDKYQNLYYEKLRGERHSARWRVAPRRDANNSVQLFLLSALFFVLGIFRYEL